MSTFPIPPSPNSPSFGNPSGPFFSPISLESRPSPVNFALSGQSSPIDYRIANQRNHLAFNSATASFPSADQILASPRRFFHLPAYHLRIYQIGDCALTQQIVPNSQPITSAPFPSNFSLAAFPESSQVPLGTDSPCVELSQRAAYNFSALQPESMNSSLSSSSSAFSPLPTASFSSNLSQNLQTANCASPPIFSVSPQQKKLLARKNEVSKYVEDLESFREIIRGKAPSLFSVAAQINNDNQSKLRKKLNLFKAIVDFSGTIETYGEFIKEKLPPADFETHYLETKKMIEYISGHKESFVSRLEKNDIQHIFQDMLMNEKLHYNVKTCLDKNPDQFSKDLLVIFKTFTKEYNQRYHKSHSCLVTENDIKTGLANYLTSRSL